MLFNLWKVEIMGFLDRYTAKAEKYWEDNYEVSIANDEEVPKNKPTLPKNFGNVTGEEKQPETPKKTPKKSKKE